jgi:hypothetical protein
MTITRVGSTGNYATGWELAFGGKRRGSKQPSTSTTRGVKKAKAAKKPAGASKATVKSAAKRVSKPATKKAKAKKRG